MPQRTGREATFVVAAVLNSCAGMQQQMTKTSLFSYMLNMLLNRYKTQDWNKNCNTESLLELSLMATNILLPYGSLQKTETTPKTSATVRIHGSCKWLDNKQVPSNETFSPCGSVEWFSRFGLGLWTLQGRFSCSNWTLLEINLNRILVFYPLKSSLANQRLCFCLLLLLHPASDV